jgi:uncharacterized protein (TIGR02284 family)
MEDAVAEQNERVVLNKLILICRDAARGFEWAAAHARDADLRTFFVDVASKRHQYVMDLLPHAYWLGGVAPEGDGSRIAALHRAWMAVKDRLAPHHDHALVVEAQRGELAALATYGEAIQTELPSEARRVVETQKAGIQEVCDRLPALAATLLGA